MFKSGFVAVIGKPNVGNTYKCFGWREGRNHKP